MGSTYEEVVTFQAGLKAPGGYLTKVKRTELEQTANAIYPIPWDAFRVWDAYATNLPAAAANDDLGLVGGTWASASPVINAGDVKAAGSSNRYARFQVTLPAEYDDAETVQIRFYAGMVTTVADNTCTIDLVAYEPDREAGIGSDLCTTAATTINSLTFANVDFTITASGLVAGDTLDCRVDIAYNDAATATAVTPTIGYAALLCDVRG